MIVVIVGNCVCAMYSNENWDDNSFWWHNGTKCIWPYELCERVSVWACVRACLWNVANIGQLGIYWYWKYVSTILDLIRSKMVRSNMNSRIAATVATAAATLAAAAPHSLLTLYRTLNIQTHTIYIHQCQWALALLAVQRCSASFVHT